MTKDNNVEAPLLSQQEDNDIRTSQLSPSSSQSFRLDEEEEDDITLQHELETNRNYTYSIEEEKQLVRKLDRRLLVFAMLGNLIKTMDNTNLSNAYISGMEEDLNIEGKQYNWMTVLFMIGYLLMQIPSNMILSRFRPSRYLPLLEIIWCILTLSMACVQSVNAVYLLRFLLGAFEAGFYPGIVFLIGTWYSVKELGKRNAWITIFGSLGSALSGLIQAALLKIADGALGISGWRWLFLFDGSITFLLAYFGYKYLPDYPSTTQWLNRKEKEIAVLRLNREGRETKQNTWKSRQIFHSLVSNKYIYFLVFGWTMLHLSMGGAHILGIIAKRVGYDAITANLFTSADMVISMLAGLGNGYMSDYFQTRIGCIAPALSISVIGFSLLAAFIQPFGVFYFAYIIMHAGLAATAPVAMTWASEIMQESVELRALSIAIMNTSSSSMYTWAPLVLWPVTDAPRYSTGFHASIGFVIGSLVCFGVIGFLRNYNIKQTQQQDNHDNEFLLSPRIQQPYNNNENYEDNEEVTQLHSTISLDRLAFS